MEMKKMIEDDLKRKSTSIYHDYGHFAIEFEQLILSMKVCVFTIFKMQGIKDFKYLRVLLHDQTASPMVSKLRSLVALHYEKEPDKIKALDKLFVNTNKIIEKRNEIIHGSFFVNSSPDGDLFKDKIVKSGLKMYEEKFDQSKFIDYTKKVMLAKTMFDYLNLELQDPSGFFGDFINEGKTEELNIDLK